MLLQASEFLRVWRTISVQKCYPYRGVGSGSRQHSPILREALRKHMGSAGNSFKIINEKYNFQLAITKRLELHSNHLLRLEFSKFFTSSKMGGGFQHHPWEILTLQEGGVSSRPHLRKVRPLISDQFPMERENSWSAFCLWKFHSRARYSCRSLLWEFPL